MIEFIIKNKVVMAISIEGLFEGEIEATKELLAYENNCDIAEISTRIQK